MKLIFFTLAIISAALAAPSSKSLQDDFKDFIDLIPTDKLKEITCNYKDDAEVQLAIKYLRSEEFSGLVEAVREKTAWKEFKNYLNGAGIDIEAIINYVHDIIVNGVCNDVSSRGGLKDLINDLRNAIPVEEVKALFHDKLENSADFQEFFAKVSSNKSRELVEEVIALEEFQKVAKKLKELGFDLQKIKDFIYKLFGWN